MFLNFVFLSSALLTVASAVMVLFTQNIMHACVYLLGALMGVAGLYVTLGADFVATTQIMVYVGGVVILMVFAVMLTGGKDFVSRAQKLLNLIPSMGNRWSYGVGIVSGVVLLASISQLICNAIKFYPQPENLSFTSTVEAIGKLLITDHVLAFEISSVLLLGALVGAAVIARPKREFTGVSEEEEH